MKNISVSTFIHTIFIVALIVISLTFYILLQSTQDQRRLQQLYRYKLIADSFLTYEDVEPSSEMLKELFKKESLIPVDSDKIKIKVEDKGKTIFSGRSVYGEVRVFKVDNDYYIYIDRYNFLMTLKDNKPFDNTVQLIFTVASILVLFLLFLYLMVLKKLYPLKKLNQQIEKFGRGDLDINIDHDGDDEIAKIAKSFDKAIKHIKQLISSKNLFMRNIMHELKTPMTTGRIVADTVEDEQARAILIKSFNRMNELVGDLAEIERITMYNFAVVKSDYLFSEIVDESKKMLLKDEKFFEFNYKEQELYTDKALLSLAIKNLVDNAIKYSPDKYARVDLIGSKILVRSKGRELEESLSYYTEPFSQAEKRSSGFGLGLYIVENVVEKIDGEFRYRYDKDREENIFEIILN